METTMRIQQEAIPPRKIKLGVETQGTRIQFE